MGLVRLPGSGIGDDEVELGYVSGVFGVTGEVRLFLHNPESALLDRERDVVLVASDDRRFGARMWARGGAGKRIIGRIVGEGVREHVADFMGWRIVIPVADLPEIDEDEFYVAELEGLAAFVDGVEIGVIDYVHTTPGGDVFEIAAKNGPIFVPAVKHFVLGVDLDARRVDIAADALEEE